MGAAGGQAPVGERAGLGLFAYGTLMFEAVVEGLVGRRLPTAPAVAAGWRAARLPGRVYPGLVPAAGGRALGLVLSGLTPAEWSVLDAFEGDSYLLRTVAVEVSGAGPDPVRVPAPVPGAGTGASGVGGPVLDAGERPASVALTYTWRNLADVEDEDWDPNWFTTHWLSRYTARLWDD
ncbi:gamma-glutamylcyclotransferase [Frankia sp. CNm7]|uniref:Putative gamma-glutamylcyclotransferase n=2 Tax=Frankia nepalensis TaxID=1836974 RepID=A0A937RIA7_9ACTN|nr:gamma-glutamylcyclotransferase [Frankia nepalensis]MBL7511118.1 gamma-glutamylcyclotransferase [Frankia nepalensis]MBL7522975.1 gamma-glutamylcyclotransferase [Frankia nepalensis]MBL7630697.1 gamma-glutamylcyclotransferase [Frankia nepalensis]